ncbi:MAG: hypothetical protein QE271_01040 [Bacteriovoracaceae bacterium]|nr:hypothetical protein [Bacteriovoracaceae bacterium]
MPARKNIRTLLIFSIFILASSLSFSQEQETPLKWKMLDCVTAQGAFDKLLIFQTPDPASNLVLVEVEIDGSTKGSVYLSKEQFDLMQATGEFVAQFDLKFSDDSIRRAEIKLSYGLQGVFIGVIRNLEESITDRVACDEPQVASANLGF